MAGKTLSSNIPPGMADEEASFANDPESGDSPKLISGHNHGNDDNNNEAATGRRRARRARARLESDSKERG